MQFAPRFQSVVNLTCGMVAMLGVISNLQTKSYAQPPNVSTYIVASDKNGAPASLDPTTIKASIGKSQARIVSLQPAKEDKLLFAVLLDISKSQADAEKSAAIKSAAVKLFQALSQGSNEGYFVVFSSKVGMSSRPLTTAEVQSSLNHIGFAGGTALFDAIAQTCQQPLSRSNNPNYPRRAIVLISDGEDNFSNMTRDAAELAAQKEGVAIFSLLLSSPPASGQYEDRGRAVLTSLSKDTGGELAVAKSLEDEIPEAITEVNHQWLLELAPQQPPSHSQRLETLKLSSTQKTIMVSNAGKILLP